jgi:3-oxoacyl-ACP reductase-like protein
VIYDGPVRNSPAPKAAPTPAKPAPASPEAAPSVAPMPETGTTTRSTSPALRKKSSIQQASAQQAIRRR